MTKILKVNKSSLISRTINIPGDKSISHRAIILLSLASNSSTIRGLLESEDCLHTIRIMQELGASIYKQGDEYIIEGKKNWEKNKSHFKGSFISEDMLICSNLVEGED